MMDLYVLRNSNRDSRYHGYYVAPAGSKNSYTPKLERARTFRSLRAAKANATGTDTPLRVSQLLNWPS